MNTNGHEEKFAEPPNGCSGFGEKAAILSSGTRWIRWRRFPVLLVEFPEQLPEILSQRMQKRVTWHHRAQMPPVPRMLHKSVLTRIVENVKADLRERASHAVLLPQHTVVGLLLQLELTTTRRAERKFGSEMLPKKLHGIALVA